MNHYERTESAEQIESQAAQQRRLAMEQRLRSAEAAKPAAPPGDNPNRRQIDHGVIDVPVRDLPRPEGVHGPADFHKYPEDEMVRELHDLENMKHTIHSGEGRSSDYWRAVDQQVGRDYQHGYQRVYEAFYGDDAVRLEKIGDKYNVINGEHRIYLAKQIGYQTLPAHVIELV